MVGHDQKSKEGKEKPKNDNLGVFNKDRAKEKAV